MIPKLKSNSPCHLYFNMYLRTTEIICDDLRNHINRVASHIRATNCFHCDAAAQQQYTRDQQSRNRIRRDRAQPAIPPVGTLRWQSCSAQLVSRVFPAVFYSNLFDIFCFTTAAVYRLFWRFNWSNPAQMHYKENQHGYGHR